MAQTNLQAGSYALEAGGLVSQKNVGRQLGQTGMVGGQVFSGQQQQRVEVDTSTSDLLMQLGSKILEPQIKKVQTENFLKGAQRVAQGEALKDIVDEQPWFTQIFGPSSSVQGARTVAQMKGVDDYITSVANDMPELQKLSSKEFGSKITDKMGEFLTGDSVADAAIQMKMVESTGALFKAHTKANYKYTQSTMQANTVGYMQSGGAKLKALSAQLLDGTITQKDYDAMKADYVTNLMPMEGQSAESYWGGIEAATIDALATSNHHAANAIFDSGLFSSAPTEMRKKMLDARHTYEARTQEEAGFTEYGPRIGILKGMAAAGQLSGNQIQSEVDKINADYTMKYGINRPLFKREELQSIISGNVSAIYNRAEQDRRDIIKEGRQDQRQAATEQAKAQTELRKGQQLVELIQMGVGNNAKMAGYTDDEVNNAVYVGAQIIAQKGGNVGEYLVRQYNEGAAHVNPLYKNQMQAGMRAAVMEGHSGKAFDTSYGLFKQISQQPGGKAAAIAYLGDDGIKMMKYDALSQSPGMTKELAYTLSFAQPLDTSRKSTDKDVAEKLEKFVNKKDPGVIDRNLFGDIPLTEQSKRTLLGAVSANYDKLAGIGMSDDAAMPVAYAATKAEYDVAGPYVIHKGADRQPLYQLIGSDEKVAGDMFSQLIAKRARENGILEELPGSPSPTAALQGTADLITAGALPAIKRWGNRTFGAQPDIMVMRLPDQDGQAMFGVTITDTTGKMTNFPMSSKEVRQYYEQSKGFK
jgi:hypothetical protein